MGRHSEGPLLLDCVAFNGAMIKGRPETDIGVLTRMWVYGSTLPTLLADDTIERGPTGTVANVNRRRLLNRWTIDYQLLKSNSTPGYYIAPRGLDAALTKAGALPNVALTGGRAGQAWLPGGVTPILPTTQLVIYTADPETTAQTLDLAPTNPSSSNVILLAPQDPAILDLP